MIRELFYYDRLKVKNGLLNALLDYYNHFRQDAVFTKREARAFIEGLQLPLSLLNLEFENLSNDEFDQTVFALKNAT